MKVELNVLQWKIGKQINIIQVKCLKDRNIRRLRKGKALSWQRGQTIKVTTSKANDEVYWHME